MTDNSTSTRIRIRRTIHRAVRRLDDWTLTVFNPYLASDHRS